MTFRILLDAKAPTATAAESGAECFLLLEGQLLPTSYNNTHTPSIHTPTIFMKVRKPLLMVKSWPTEVCKSHTF